jgi:hypothetical protein
VGDEHSKHSQIIYHMQVILVAGKMAEM